MREIESLQVHARYLTLSLKKTCINWFYFLKERIKLRKQRQKLRAELGDDAPPIEAPKTLDNQREKEDTIVQKDDREVLLDEESDEMAPYFERKQSPKILLTTSDRPRSVSGFVQLDSDVAFSTAEGFLATFGSNFCIMLAYKK